MVQSKQLWTSGVAGMYMYPAILNAKALLQALERYACDHYHVMLKDLLT